MSANAYYSIQREGIYIKGDVNNHIKQFLEKDGAHEIEVSIGSCFYYYIKGLAAANVTGALELLDVIDAKEYITIWLEY